MVGGGCSASTYSTAVFMDPGQGACLVRASRRRPCTVQRPRVERHDQLHARQFLLPRPTTMALHFETT